MTWDRPSLSNKTERYLAAAHYRLWRMDHTGDIIAESAAGGVDRINATVGVNLDRENGAYANVENVWLQGSANIGDWDQQQTIGLSETGEPMFWTGGTETIYWKLRPEAIPCGAELAMTPLMALQSGPATCLSPRPENISASAGT
ncbi:hypothetical protein [Paracoccus sp. pheM1]|uniref:hypothetical protein n=1 Tax=Paracoccus sp. pheM1 TaxID=2831675 RepID=UPI001F0B6ACF|nr:hypothetical protein [Paracoccus sp. pheM1]